MHAEDTSKANARTTAEKVVLYGLMLWLLLQVSRAIALTLIGDINDGAESAAWLFPAYLDLFAAVFALPLVWAVWKRPGFVTWSFVVSYLVISIVDHVGNFVTTGEVGAPSIVEEGSNPYLFPGIMTIVDTMFLLALFVPKYRQRLFFGLHGESGLATA